MEFFEEVIKKLSTIFEKKFNIVNYPNQDVKSCQSIYDLMMKTKPDYVFDIGTNFGASTMALAKACVDLGKPLSIITTIDVNHRNWLEETIPSMSGILKENNINVEEICLMTAEFSSIKPPSILSSSMRGLIFYDIHDLPDKSLIDLFFSNWVKNFHGIIMFHDVSVVPLSYKDKTNQFSAVHFSGKRLCGFREVIPLVKKLNDSNILLETVSETSILYVNV